MELREFSHPDEDLLGKIGKLRVEAWKTEAPGAAAMEKWLDEFDRSARHWTVFESGMLVASARLTMHSTLADVPDAPSYAGVFRDPPGAPIGSLNRLVVHPSVRGLGLSKRLDLVRLEAAERMGCRSVILATASGSHRVRQLIGWGFELIGQGPPLSGPSALLFAAARGDGAPFSRASPRMPGPRRLKPAQQRLRHLRDARLVIEEAIGDQCVDLHRPGDEALEQRLEFVGPRDGRRRHGGLRLILIAGRANEGRPVDPPDIVNERIDGRGRAARFQHLGRDALPQERAAFRHAPQDAPRHLWMLPEKLKNGDRLGAHLEDPPIGVPAAKEPKKGAKFNLPSRGAPKGRVGRRAFLKSRPRNWR